MINKIRFNVTALVLGKNDSQNKRVSVNYDAASTAQAKFFFNKEYGYSGIRDLKIVEAKQETDDEFSPYNAKVMFERLDFITHKYNVKNIKVLQKVYNQHDVLTRYSGTDMILTEFLASHTRYAEDAFEYKITPAMKPFISWHEPYIEVVIACRSKINNNEEETTMAKSKIYGVKVGRVPGVYTTWDECEAQVKGFQGAEFNGKFTSVAEATLWVFGSTTVEPKNEEVDIVSDFRSEVDITPVPKAHVSTKQTYAYVDGSFSKGRYSSGIVIVEDNKVIHSFSAIGENEEAAKMNNVAGELSAAMRAAQWAQKNNKKIIIVHDYEGVGKWARNEWKANLEFTKKYKAFIQPYMKAGIITNFQWVKGHSENEFNEMADKLAKKELGIEVK